MTVNDLFYEYDINILKADHAFESSFDSFVISITDLINKKRNGLIAESTDMDSVLVEEANKFTTAINEFFKTILDSIHALVEKVQDKIDTMIKQYEINKKLKDIKKEAAKLYDLENDKKITVLDTKKYNKAFTEYINYTVTEFKKVQNKNYESIEEYDDAFNNYYDNISEKWDKLGLDYENNYYDAMWFEDVVENVIKDDLIAKRISEEIHKKWVNAVEQIRDLTKDETDSAKINGAKRITTTVSNNSSHAYRTVTNNNMNILHKIIGFISKKDKEESEEKKED